MAFKFVDFLFSAVLPGFERNHFIFPQPLPIDSWGGLTSSSILILPGTAKTEQNTCLCQVMWACCIAVEMCHQCPNFGQVLLTERETWEAQHVELAQFHPCTKRSYRSAVQNGRWYCDVSLVEAFVYLHVSAWNVVFPIDHVDASRCKDISPRPVFVSSWFRKSGSCTEPSLALCPRKKLLKACQLRLSRWTLCILRMVTFDNLNWWLLRVEVADRECQGRELCKSRRNCIPQLGAEEPIWRALFLSQVISFPRRWPFVALNWCQADFVVRPMPDNYLYLQPCYNVMRKTWPSFVLAKWQ